MNVATIIDKNQAWTESSLNFVSNNKNAKFVKIDIKNLDHELLSSKARIVRDYFLSKWSLDYPKLVISVAGSAQNFTIPKRLEKAFKRGLYKAASNADAWILTSGTNCGVMRLVGEALADEIDGDIVCLGISSWSILEKKDDIGNHLKNNKEKRYKYVNVNDIDSGNNFVDDTTNKSNPSRLVKAHLDQNHTHFLLLNSGTNDIQEEIDFSLELEMQLRNKTSDDIIPTILIVVNGGINTLKTVTYALEYEIPILVLAESKGCADLICEIVTDFQSRDYLDEDELVNKLLDKYKKNLRFQNQEERNERKAIVKQFLDAYKTKMDKQLLNIFRLNENENDDDIDVEILETLIRVNVNTNDRAYFKTFELALSWNCIDIAKRKLLNGDEKISVNDRHELLEKALIENKYEFVELLIDYGVNLRTFLTNQRLNRLYERVARNNVSEPFKRLLKLMILSNKTRKAEINYSKSVRLILSDLTFLLFPTTILPNEEDNSVSLQKNHAAEKLFLWAILNNRIEIAKIFWKRTDFLIANALVASKILRSMSKRLPDFKDILYQRSEEFEDLGICVLQECLKRTHDEMNGIILLLILPLYDDCIINLAHKCECLRFMAQEPVQNMIHRIWSFKTNYTYKSSCLDIFPRYLDFFFEKESYIDRKELYPFEQALFDEAKQDKDNNLLCKELERIKDDISENESKRKPACFDKIKITERNFRIAPCGIYLLSMISHLSFLLLMSRKVLYVEREFFEDILIYLWLWSLYATEMFELCAIDLYKNTLTFSKRLAFRQNIIQIQILLPRKIFIPRYFKDIWNLFDFFGLLVYQIGAGFENVNDNIYRLLLILDFMIWSIGFLQYCAIFKKIGQTYAMIREIIKRHLLFFLVVFTVLCATYGAAVTSLYVANEYQLELTNKSEIIKDIVDLSYWPLFNQMLNVPCLLSLNGCDDEAFSKQTDNEKALRYCLMMIYSIVILVLVNVLIALFNKTFQQVDVQSEIIWKYERYRFVMSYAGSLEIFPPFTLLYVFYFSVRSTWILIRDKCCKKKTLDYVNQTEYCHTESTVDYSNIQLFEKKCAEYFLRKLNKENVSKQILEKLSDDVLNVQQRIFEIQKRNVKKAQRPIKSKLSRQGDQSALF